MAVEVQSFVSMPFDQNAYLLHRPGRPDCVVVDPGFETSDLLDRVAREKWGIAAILNTHGHVDHIAGNAAVRDAFPDAPLIIGTLDAPMLTDADLNLSGPFGIPITSPPADRLVNPGDVLEIAGMTFEVRFAPGHSPGHVVFVLRDNTPVIVLAGDVLFHEGIGRYDFPGGSLQTLARSIREQLYSLPDDAVVYPGHGPDTTIGHEKKFNPFVPAVAD